MPEKHEVIVDYTLNELQRELPPKLFVRIHETA